MEIDSHYVNALWWQGLALAGKGRFAPAIECLQRAVERSPIPMSLGYLGHVLGLAGERTAASDILRKLAELQSRQYVSPVDFAVVEAGLGNGGAMFEWLETGCRSRASRVHELRTPIFDAVRTDPQYANLLKRTGLIPQAPSSPPTT